MENKKSPLYIDPFKYPNDTDINEKWRQWETRKEGKACKKPAIKWLQCMGIVKEFYKMEGRNVKDGMAWQKYMLDKCYASYTDYVGCSLEEKQAQIERLKAQHGEEKWKNSENLVKEKLIEEYGAERADQLWNYSKDYHARFLALRKLVDEERGVIRNGMKVPDIETKPELSATARTEKQSIPKQPPQPQESSDDNPQTGFDGFKGWWSQPESRFKKPSGSSDT